LPKDPQIWISFAPIWLLAPFLSALVRHHPEALAGLKGVVACSSSSVITKRFAANRFDRELVARLAAAQEQLLQLCERLGVPCRILAPTLIHGRSAHHADRNVEALRRLLRRTPLLPLPADTGLRQPIAAADLAAVALRQSRLLLAGALVGQPPLLTLGGDETLTYRALLERIQAADPRAARCRLVSLPTPLFQWLASPLLLLAPKTFAAVQRLSADLAGFPRAADLLGRPPRPFAVPAP
jgi:nucleoside-diphosphate-sugar epimerase